MTYFCDRDTHLNNGLRPLSAYTAVVRLPTTAAFLVFTDDVIRSLFGL